MVWTMIVHQTLFLMLREKTAEMSRLLGSRLSLTLGALHQKRSCANLKVVFENIPPVPLLLFVGLPDEATRAASGTVAIP